MFRFFLCGLITLFCYESFSDNSKRQEQFEDLIEHLVDNEETKEVKIQEAGSLYTVVVGNERVRGLMKAKYSSEDLKKLDDLLAKSTEIKINERGFVQAADRNLKDGEDPTNYNAVWLRDSLWAYLALNSREETKADAKRVLRGMLDYISAEKQLKRFEAIIGTPTLATSPNGSMEVVHIRFDGKSADFQDVKVNGEPQQWNHKQNDALGLLLDLSVRAIQKGEIEVTDLSESNWMALAYLPAYFSRIKFYQMEDAGPWEEIERTNTSSMALVVSGLERLSDALYTVKKALPFRSAQVAKSDFSTKLLKIAKGMKAVKGQKPFKFLSKASLKGSIDLGYKRILKQLEAGGESPIYKKGDPKLRDADAALLNLIYPAQLSRLKLAQKKNILRIIAPLIGRVGVKRYVNDSYQAGNFWFLDLTQSGPVDERTADTSSREGFETRNSRFIPATEAQWFFDSWISKCYGLFYKESNLAADRAEQIRFFNRALGQATAGKVRGADGAYVPELAFPESYNTVALDHSQFFVPSPITPLNWAKASYLLARQEM
jgi:hypothetical protein